MINGERRSDQVARAELGDYIFDMLGQIAILADGYEEDLAERIRSLIEDYATETSRDVNRKADE